MLNISKLKYALFDWDNTLVESRKPLVTAINIVLKKYKMPDWEQVKQLRNCNLSFKDNFPLIFKGVAEEAYDTYRKVYLKIMPTQIKKFSYVSEVLELMGNLGIQLYVVSNKERLLLEKERDFLFSGICFRKIVCGHEAPEDKPSPHQIFYALSEDIKPEEITPEEVWMIGDSPMDSQAAIAANATPIRIGQSIWGDEGEANTHIIYFNCFKDFYQNIGTKA